MGSATSTMDVRMSMIQMSTAAANVSGIAFSKTSKNATNMCFDGFLAKASEGKVQNISYNSGSGNETPVKTDKKNIEPVKKETYSKDSEPKAEEASKEVKTVVNETTTEKCSDTNEEKVNIDTKTADTQTNVKLQEKADDDAKKIIAELAELLDISEDKIINAMQMLGIMPATLLDSQNVKLMVTDILGEDKALDLITDSDLYTQMQDLMEGAEGMRSELMKEFNLSDEEFDAVVKEFNEVIRPVEGTTSKEPVVEVKDMHVTSDTSEEIVFTAKNDVKDSEAPQSNVLTDTVAVDKTDIVSKNTAINDELNKEKIVEKPVAEEFEAVEPKDPVVKAPGETAKKNSSNDFTGSNQNTNPFNQILSNISEAVSTTETTTVEYTDRAQFENIVRQITEKISIVHNTQETSMELQLHPAHLGHVNILLTSGKDGIIAKFTAQNQIVKEAVETQMIQLQQKFDEQGIKVTAIEVTIASHAFEQNFQQNEQNKAFEETQAKSKKSLRRINLSDVDEILEEEEMSDEDRLAASIMEMNGNTVDFSA
ncbi:flagellar hook-length control protein FliK [Butyrivibrio sp. YAB3001]|uniref:flagellar hook-length control protein FliK n=1 Tax=Butyrivibrio sp. YAB3001 TaxID=1520812 RepID=UPI0008F633C8|nr:flagellar hook-length control protein FliK [Butyrivibrio sp. YAB3001]SFB66732.1 flagellar hook-length control protein FliK [Butyrivibrio sp. YAB3001]